MKGLSIIKPLVITPAMLVSTDVAEADYSAYSAGTTYAAGDRVIRDHLIYQSLQAGNTGHTPETSPTWWVKVSATNRWKLFDLVNSSQTAQSTSMTYTIRPGTVVTALAAVNLTAVGSIRVRMISDAYGSVYDKTISRSRTPAASGWWNWFYGRRTESLSSYFTDLPSFADAQIIVDFTGLSNMAVGTLLLGVTSNWGQGVQINMSLSLRDYSKKETNDWGDIVLTQRAYAKKTRVPLVITRTEVNPLYAYLSSIRATPCLWITDLDAVYGYYQDFEILIAYSAVSECDLTIEGLT